MMEGGEVLRMDIWDTTELAEFSKTQRVKKDLCKTKMFNVVLVCLEKGQEIPPRPEPYDVCFYVIDGRGIFTIGDQQRELKSGSMVLALADVVRGIRSIERMSVLGIQEAH
jgi:quercetin dioxygenase-like cupin family protein